MRKSTLCIQIILVLLGVGSLSSLFAQTFDISSGGTPTITGNLVGGSVTGNTSVLNSLAFTINFGEVSPSNTNSIVKVVIPIGIRGSGDYKVTATLTGTGNANPQAIQSSDIGLGVNNIRAMGAKSKTCTKSTHLFYAPFTTDPTTSVTINAAGRATYPGNLSGLVGGPTLVSGPTLTQGAMGRAADNGYIFDAIFAVKPQFFANGNTSFTVTFTISAGPAVPC